MWNSKVTSSQYFSLLYLCMLGSVFMYISSTESAISDADALLRPIAFAIVTPALAVPIFLYYRKYRVKESFVSEGNLVDKIVFAFYALIYFVDALITTARFDLFASSELFPGNDMRFFMVFLVVICAVISLWGFRGLTGGNVVFTVAIVLATGFAMLTLIKEIDFLNFNPFFEKGGAQFVSDSFMFTIQASELGSLFLVFPCLKGNVKKHFAAWTILGALSFSIIFFFVTGTLGVFADTQLFPTYSAVTLAEFGLLERLDALETSIWILCVVSKLTFYFILVTACVRRVYSRASAGVVVSVITLLLCVLISFISGDVKKFGFATATPLVVAVYIIPVLVLPLVMLVNRKIERMKADEN